MGIGGGGGGSVEVNVTRGTVAESANHCATVRNRSLTIVNGVDWDRDVKAVNGAHLVHFKPDTAMPFPGTSPRSLGERDGAGPSRTLGSTAAKW